MLKNKSFDKITLPKWFRKNKEKSNKEKTNTKQRIIQYPGLHPQLFLPFPR